MGLGGELNEQSDSIHTKIWNYFLINIFLLYFFGHVFVVLVVSFWAFKFLIDFQIWIHTSFIHIVYFISRCLRNAVSTILT